MALDGNARADEAREVRSGRWIGHNGDSTPRNSAYARKLKPCQYRAADNAAMELVNGTLLPNHIITSERYEPAAVRVLRSLRSRLNARLWRQSIALEPHGSGTQQKTMLKNRCQTIQKYLKNNTKIGPKSKIIPK